MACNIIENNGLIEVYADNGNPSILFDSILKLPFIKNREDALNYYTHSKLIKTDDYIVDKNNEPVLTFISLSEGNDLMTNRLIVDESFEDAFNNDSLKKGIKYGFIKGSGLDTSGYVNTSIPALKAIHSNKVNSSNSNIVKLEYKNKNQYALLNSNDFIELGELKRNTFNNTYESFIEELMTKGVVNERVTNSVSKPILEPKEFIDKHFENIENNAREIIKGERVLEPFTQEENRGIQLGTEILAGAAILVERLYEAGGTNKIAEYIEEYAKKKGVWVNNISNRYGNPNAMGAESSVWFNEQEKTVTKSTNAFLFNQGELKGVKARLENIILSNYLFPVTRLKVIGFGRYEKGLDIIVEQPVVIADRGAFQVETRNYMKDLGFKDIGERLDDNTYSNERYIIDDLHSDNVLKRKDGNLFIIDANISLKNKEDIELSDNIIENEMDAVIDDLIEKEEITRICKI